MTPRKVSGEHSKIREVVNPKIGFAFVGFKGYERLLVTDDERCQPHHNSRYSYTIF
jgi:hypothetical protein